MHKNTLNQRAAGLNRPARIRVSLPLGTLLRLEGIARQRGMTREQAMGEAARDWMLRHEQGLTRRNRLVVEKAMRSAMNSRSLEEVLSMISSHNAGPPVELASAGNTSAAGRGRNIPMSSISITLKERRNALGLSRQELATRAECSISMLQMVESGYVPDPSKVVDRIERALDKAEIEQ